jgi:Protein of unknown function (DUF2997)
MPKINIEIPLVGNPVITVDGVKGSGCKELTKKLERALGSTEKDTNTKEYNEKDNKQSINQY